MYKVFLSQTQAWQNNKGVYNILNNLFFYYCIMSYQNRINDEISKITMSDGLLNKDWLLEENDWSVQPDDIPQVVNDVSDKIANISDWKRNSDGQIVMSDELLEWLEKNNRKYLRMRCDSEYAKVLCQHSSTGNVYELKKVNISKGGLWLVSKVIIWTQWNKLMFNFISNWRNILVEWIIRYIWNTKNKWEFYYWVEFLNLSPEDKKWILVSVDKNKNTPSENVNQESNIVPDRSRRVKLEDLGLDIKVKCRNMWNKKVSENDTIVDISEEWIWISSFNFIERTIGTIVDLEFTLNKRKLFLRSKITRKSERKKNNEIFFGLEFIDILDNDKRHIKDTISANTFKS